MNEHFRNNTKHVMLQDYILFNQSQTCGLINAYKINMNSYIGQGRCAFTVKSYQSILSIFEDFFLLLFLYSVNCSERNVHATHQGNVTLPIYWFRNKNDTELSLEYWQNRGRARYNTIDSMAPWKIHMSFYCFSKGYISIGNKATVPWCVLIITNNAYHFYLFYKLPMMSFKTFIQVIYIQLWLRNLQEVLGSWPLQGALVFKCTMYMYQ